MRNAEVMPPFSGMKIPEPNGSFFTSAFLFCPETPGGFTPATEMQNINYSM